MICPKCRNDNAEDAVHCVNCDTPFRPVDPPGEVPALGGSPSPSGDHSTWVSPFGSGSPFPRTTPPEALAAGTQLGPRYRILSLLGKGGMGAVYKAHDLELDRIVALKLIRPDLAAHPEAMQRFKQELLLASRISAKSILRIHDLSEAGGLRFISMAYVEGEDLHARLTREGRMPVAQILHIARQLCAALVAAHAEGIIHRDLKPQNVLLDREGNAYVSDFGLAKGLDADAAQMTRTGEMLGTPRYMSPEQVEGKPADRRSDIYALGLILYEMAVGEAPFAAETVFQSMFLRTRERPRDPMLLNAEIPEFLARITLRCLERNPDQRYPDAGDVLRDLEAARAPGRSPRITRSRVRARRWILGAGLVVAAAALTVPGSPVGRMLWPRIAAALGARDPDRPAGGRRYVAVLPFEVLGDPTSLGHIAAGVGEALAARLRQSKDVYVPPSSHTQEAASQGSLEKAARDLGVTLIVHGTVTASGDRVAFVVDLEDMKRGARIWAKEFSGLQPDLLTLEDQIYAELLAALRIVPNEEERARAMVHSTDNVAAYDLYLKGRNALRGHQDVANVKSALALFEQAVKLDAGFALAYVGLADASLAMHRETRDNEWAQRAVAAGEQARRLNDALPEVALSLGSIYAATGRTAEAVAVLTRARELSPNSDEANRRLGAAYEAAGRAEEAIAAYRKAIEINPYYWLNSSVLGGAYFKTGRLEDALGAYRRIQELEPDNVWGYLNVGAVLFSQGKYEECIPLFRRALEIQPSWQTLSNLGTAYFYLKRYPESVATFEEAAAMNPNQMVVIGNLADAYRWSGQAERAAGAYARAIALANKGLEVNPRDADAMSNLALCHAKRTEFSRALDFIRRARSIDADNVDFLYTEAVVRALAGQKQEAVAALAQALDRGYSPTDAASNPEFAGLSELPEFRELLERFSATRPAALP